MPVRQVAHDDEAEMITLDEFATLVRLFGRRARIGRDGAVSIDRPAPAVWDGRAEPECSDLESTPRSAVRPISCQSPGQRIGGPANLLAIGPATDLVARGAGAT